MTYSEAEFKFSIKTEHDIPDGGYLTIQLPEEMNFNQQAVETQQIDHNKPNSLSFDSLTETTISFKVPNGLDTSVSSVAVTLK